MTKEDTAPFENVSRMFERLDKIERVAEGIKEGKFYDGEPVQKPNPGRAANDTNESDPVDVEEVNPDENEEVSLDESNESEEVKVDEPDKAEPEADQQNDEDSIQVESEAEDAAFDESDISEEQENSTGAIELHSPELKTDSDFIGILDGPDIDEDLLQDLRQLDGSPHVQLSENEKGRCLFLEQVHLPVENKTVLLPNPYDKYAMDIAGQIFSDKRSAGYKMICEGHPQGEIRSSKSNQYIQTRKTNMWWEIFVGPLPRHLRIGMQEGNLKGTVNPFNLKVEELKSPDTGKGDRIKRFPIEFLRDIEIDFDYSPEHILGLVDATEEQKQMLYKCRESMNRFNYFDEDNGSANELFEGNVRDLEPEEQAIFTEGNSVGVIEERST
jgi:hypothetical protein